ncbi:hypothetical protein SpCBS45565_g06444 [Spizellomyces sp. 'palustris']|nr:hypothetical protein SpCBS45565_g06444 [Spizellomyces sp. 'palustris']
MNYRRSNRKNWTQNDEDSIRRPALPLEGYDEDEPLLAPGDPPASGLQYLRMTGSHSLVRIFARRAEANACQQVVTVRLPAEKLYSPIPPNVFDVRKEYFGTKASGDESYIPENLRPSADWLNNFLERFSALHDEVAKRRQILRTKSVYSRFYRPNLYNERGWKRFCYGDLIENAPQQPSANNHTPNAPAHEPSVSEDAPEKVPELTLEDVSEISPQEHEGAKDSSDSDMLKKRKREFDEVEGDTPQKSKRLHTQSGEPIHDEQAKKPPPKQGEVIKVLKYHTDWLSDDDISEEQCQWIFALLLRLDTLLHGDEVSIIRDLCRKCRGIRSHMIDLDAGDARAATLSMIVAIVSHIFGQRDLGDQVS